MEIVLDPTWSVTATQSKTKIQGVKEGPRWHELMDAFRDHGMAQTECRFTFRGMSFSGRFRSMANQKVDGNYVANLFVCTIKT
jgi:hypothetical protein